WVEGRSRIGGLPHPARSGADEHRDLAVLLRPGSDGRDSPTHPAGADIPRSESRDEGRAGERIGRRRPPEQHPPDWGDHREALFTGAGKAKTVSSTGTLASARS